MQDHLIPKSAWKEFSSNTNYAFEAFETNDKKQHVNNHKNKHDYREPDGKSDQTTPVIISRVQRPQTRPPSVPSNQPGNHPGDMRSLQRPKGKYPTSNFERTTFSLPRTAYERNQRGGPPDMQPDFYFMPSQRKYSGEVVRVFVDYNKEK